MAKKFNLIQIEEIQRHRWIESEKVGYDIGEDAAALDWIKNHSAQFRREYQEKQNKNKG